MNLQLEQTSLPADMAGEFTAASPFGLAVVDNFLPADTAEGLLLEIAANAAFQKSNDYIFAKNKFENPNLGELGPHAQALKALLLSDAFAASLSLMYGRALFVDPDFVGGGLHRGGEGSFLDMHVDFGLHPRHPRWIRELNVLLYLNKDWQPSFGGELQLRNSNTGTTRCVEPRFNRLVIMLTKDHTFHGYRAISFPSGSYRTSIAAYAYSEAQSEAELANLRTTTQWAPEDGGALKRTVAKVTPALVTIKQKLFGSATARKK